MRRTYVWLLLEVLLRAVVAGLFAIALMLMVMGLFDLAGVSVEWRNP